LILLQRCKKTAKTESVLIFFISLGQVFFN
jgi:hypothetical protein